MCVCVWALKYTAKGVKIKGIVHTLNEQMKMCVCVLRSIAFNMPSRWYLRVWMCDAYIYFTRGSKHKRKPLDTQHAYTTTICHTDMPNMKFKRTRNRILMMLTIDFPNYSPHSLYCTLFWFFCTIIFSFACHPLIALFEFSILLSRSPQIQVIESTKWSIWSASLHIRYGYKI